MGKNHKTTRASRKTYLEFREECEHELQPDGTIGRPCWICRQAIDYAAPADDYKNDDRFERDHIKPVEQYPELAEDPANWEASHAGCNRNKSNGQARPPLGEPSRAWV